MRVFLLLLVSFLVFSCSIQKRQHLPGYYITFHKNYQSSSKEINHKEVIVTEENELVNEETIRHEAITLTENSPSINDETIIEENEPEDKVIVNKAKYQLQFDLKSNKIKLKQYNKLTNSGKKDLYNGEQTVSIFALLGFFFGIFGFLVLLLTGFPFLMGVAAIVLSSIALHRLKTGKDVGRGKGLAIAGLILGILSVLIFWIIIIAVVLFLSSAFYW